MELIVSLERGEDQKRNVVSIDEIRKWKLQLPKWACGEDDLLDEEEMNHVMHKVNRAIPEKQVATLISSSSREGEWGEHESLVKELREALHSDYDGVVFRNSVFPNPPIRGPHCEAQIFLKPGAQPKKQRAIPLFGERLEAMTEIAHEWLSSQKTEPGRVHGALQVSRLPKRKRENGEE